MKKNSKLMHNVQNIAKALVIPIGMWVLFAVLSGGRTATVKMLITTMRQAVVPCIICYGLMLNMSVGMMNFSVGGMVLFAGIIGGNLAKSTGTGIAGLVFFCIVVCVLEGIITGLLYNKLRVPCIVLTIGMLLIWESAPKLFYENGVNLKAGMTILARSPYCFIILAFVFVMFHVLYNKTAFGHNLRAIGANQSIANSVGLDSDKIKFMSFTLGAVFFGIAAFLYVSERGEVRNVAALGSMTIMMDGFMGMFIAMFLQKYCGMAVGVIIGSFAMKMLSNGFVALGFSATMRDVVQGIFLLVLLTISANAGLFERHRADKTFKEKCEAERSKMTA